MKNRTFRFLSVNKIDVSAKRERENVKNNFETYSLLAHSIYFYIDLLFTYVILSCKIKRKTNLTRSLTEASKIKTYP